MTVMALKSLLASLSRAAAAVLATGLMCATAHAQTTEAVRNTPAAPRGPEALVLQDERGVRPPPLGAELFEGSAPAVSNEIVDAAYVMKPGDRVRVTLFGLVNNDQELTVDSQGNVIVPGVGPVRIAGVPAGDVAGTVERAARTVYSSGVQVYAAPLASAAVQVMVTGPVVRPGAYPGAADDALVTYLQRAGGIDADRGSYRSIRIVRGGRTIAEADLYAFLRDGFLPDVSFRNGDAIVVGPQGPIVSVSGDARAPFTFELKGEEGSGAEIIGISRPRPEATHAAIVGFRDGQPFSTYAPLDQFAGVSLRDGDRVQFEADARAQSVMVRVEGAHSGPSVFSVPRGATVGSVLAQVAVDRDADMSSIHLRRPSVKATQKALIEESLERLERAVFLSPARTQSEATARAASMEFVADFVERARQVEPDGVLALADQDLNAVKIESGDVIVIPAQSQVVTISGEVNAPQSLIHRSNADVAAYVRHAGGYTSRADRRNVLVFRPDGRMRERGQVQAGDRILVLTKPDSAWLAFARDLTQTLYQIAVAARVAVDL